jgi:hypothetical protein
MTTLDTHTGIPMSERERGFLIGLLRLARPVVAGPASGFGQPVQAGATLENWLNYHLPTTSEIDTLIHRLENHP